MQKYNTNLSHKSPDFIFILILLCIFAFGSLGVVIFGTNIYANITDQTDTNFNKITPLSYIASKVRAHDGVGNIRTVQKEGTTALVLIEEENGTTYETWIYSYDNYLYDLLVESGTGFNLSDGIQLIPNYGLEMSFSDNRLLKLNSYDQNGKALSLNVAIRSNSNSQEVEDGN